MGFFTDLFEKKTCDLCGGDIGLLGNRKLEDGNCCRKCAKKLSPWFTERRHSTVEDIRMQLESREKNRQAVAAFRVTRQFGADMKVLVDEKARKFMVTKADRDEMEEENPDVLDFSQVTACDLNILESNHEVYHREKNAEGEYRSVSYDPKRYRYTYNFQMKICVEHPYIDEMELSLSDGYFQVRARNRLTPTSFLFGDDHDALGSDGSSANPPSPADFRDNDDYVRCSQWAEDIREILMSKAPAGYAPGEPRPVSREKAENSFAFCPYCGSKIAGGNFCPHCGSKLS